MRLPAIAPLAALSLSAGALAAQPPQYGAKFCSAVNAVVDAFHQQRPATSFCASYLHLSTCYTTQTTTPTTTVSSTSTVSTTTSAVVTVTTTTGTFVTSTTTVGQPIDSTSVTSVTTIVATSTVYTTTVTEATTQTATSVASTTTTVQTTAPLTNCPAPTILGKRAEERGLAVPKPKCFSGYNNAPVISSACSCLSIPHTTVTRTTGASTTKTIVKSFTTTKTITISSTATAVRTTTGTVPQTITISTTHEVDSTTTISSTFTTSIASTITTSTVTTTTSTSTATATNTRLSHFALLASYNDQYGSIRDSVGGSGEGVYFSVNDLASAASFSMEGNQLYYNGQYINSYAASSGNYYIVVDRPYAQFGYPTECTLSANQGGFSGAPGGCVVSCAVGSSGFFESASGNDVTNYGGAWGLQGSTDQFTVYAVGMTT